MSGEREVESSHAMHMLLSGCSSVHISLAKALLHNTYIIVHSLHHELARAEEWMLNPRHLMLILEMAYFPHFST